MNKKQRLENWYFQNHNVQMCLPHQAGSVCGDYVTGGGVSSSGIDHIDMNIRIVTTCTDDYYELGKPAGKYVKFVKKMKHDYIKFDRMLDKWNEKITFMKDLKAI